MDKNKLNKNIDDVHIEQINPREEFNDLEKTAIFQFLVDEEFRKAVSDPENKEEELSKTQQLRILNTKMKKVVDEFELPKTSSKKIEVKKIEEELEMPKKVNNLSDTIRIKLSDLRAAIDEREKELETKKQEETKKKSLYDTVIIKLDDIINNRKALKSVSALKVVWMDEPSHIHDKKKRFAKVKDITKTRTFTLNVDSEEFPTQLTNLNKIAVNRLSSRKATPIRNISE